MRRTAIALMFSGLAVSIAIQAQGLDRTIFVDCSAAPGGDGSRRAPLPTITAAMSVARTLGGAAAQIKIDVAGGICNDETLPIRLDVPVWLKGARSPIVRDDQRPNDHDPTAPPVVIAANNTLVYRVVGIGVAAAGPLGTVLRATFTDNDVVTSYTNSGPSNPAAIRLAPFFGGTPDVRPTLDIVIDGNFIGGSAKYGMIIHAGQNTRRSDGRSYTGDVETRFESNVIGGGVLHPALITFTNARATALPCELNPTLPPGPACPSLPNPPVYWEYLTNARFDLQHTGELDAALIDYPELQPVDGYPLDNALSINGEPIGYQTFVVVPGL